MRKAEHLRFAILAAQREGNRLLIQALKPHGAEIEEYLYSSMEAASEGLDTDAMLTFLHDFIDPLPSGQAPNKRLDLD
ncbi:hypothetical protein [Streptomyces sp. NPDC046374]|uniref:hypothetical protein n=1 Tax=unclassified Streptomyces TaxID=2593676 RepID=UPI0033CA7CAC